jgi:hypothetical protein
MTHWSFFLLWPIERAKTLRRNRSVPDARGTGLSAGGRTGGQLTGADENEDGEPTAAERGEGIRRR